MKKTFQKKEKNTITGENFKRFFENLTNEISEILNEKRVNDTAKYPDSNGECWVQIAEDVTKNCPRVQVWGFYTPENDGVTVEVWDTETNAQQRVTVCENGELSTDSLWVLLGEIAHATAANVHFSEAAGVESVQICNK